MKTRIQRLICLLFLALAQPAGAAPNTITNGDSLAASCYLALTALDRGMEQIPQDEQASTFVCMAYLGGILAAAQHANGLAKLRFAQATGGKGAQAGFNLYCFDWNLRYRDAARIVLRYARRHLELATQPADRLAMKALQDAYPCRP
ncbi:MAG TPA: hypothetical protein ENJ17_01450 [Gammaproteobacteria bacterium]|nr:hypothetical protein [Gammaproteobacteria bacterium]